MDGWERYAQRETDRNRSVSARPNAEDNVRLPESTIGRAMLFATAVPMVVSFMALPWITGSVWGRADEGEVWAVVLLMILTPFAMISALIWLMLVFLVISGGLSLLREGTTLALMLLQAGALLALAAAMALNAPLLGGAALACFVVLAIAAVFIRPPGTYAEWMAMPVHLAGVLDFRRTAWRWLRQGSCLWKRRFRASRRHGLGRHVRTAFPPSSAPTARV